MAFYRIRYFPEMDCGTYQSLTEEDITSYTNDSMPSKGELSLVSFELGSRQGTVCRW